MMSKKIQQLDSIRKDYHPNPSASVYQALSPLNNTKDYPSKKPRTDDINLYASNNRQGIEPNTSYARYSYRSSQSRENNTDLGDKRNTNDISNNIYSGSRSSFSNNGDINNRIPSSSSITANQELHRHNLNSHLQIDSTRNPQTEEDQRFLQLAKEALVATAGAKDENQLVDPTIKDLLRRLQYASSPHGNPIKRGKRIETNENGQLKIQDFYKKFPDLSNNIFMEPEGNAIVNESINSHASMVSLQETTSRQDWNFLIGNPMNFKAQHMEQQRQESLKLQDDKDLDKDDDEFNDDSRKFTCQKCFMSFRRSSDLKRHEKQHLSIPPNICERCGKGFARKDALKRHVGTLTCKRNADRKLYIDNLNHVEGDQRSIGGIERDWSI